VKAESARPTTLRDEAEKLMSLLDKRGKNEQQQKNDRDTRGKQLRPHSYNIETPGTFNQPEEF